MSIEQQKVDCGIPANEDTITIWGFIGCSRSVMALGTFKW